jgi:acetyltransferase-like isoleucine patch superfamily enzyme
MNDLLSIAPDVKLGKDVKLAKFINLYGCAVGDETKIGAFVEIQKNASVGRRCKISSHTFICEGVTIEDHVFVGHGVMFINDRTPRVSGDWELERTLVEDGASIGSNATIMGGVRIGAGALVGAGAVVTRDVTNHSLVVGSPAHRIGWVCACGARLVDSKGDPMAAEPGRYAAHLELICPSCGRTYAYIPDAETLEERSGPKPVAPPA